MRSKDGCWMPSVKTELSGKTPSSIPFKKTMYMVIRAAWMTMKMMVV